MSRLGVNKYILKIIFLKVGPKTNQIRGAVKNGKNFTLCVKLGGSPKFGV